eukprot:jgi/Mesen1/8091/ME000434S07342
MLSLTAGVSPPLAIQLSSLSTKRSESPPGCRVPVSCCGSLTSSPGRRLEDFHGRGSQISLLSSGHWSRSDFRSEAQFLGVAYSRATSYLRDASLPGAGTSKRSPHELHKLLIFKYGFLGISCAETRNVEAGRSLHCLVAGSHSQSFYGTRLTVNSQSSARRSEGMTSGGVGWGWKTLGMAAGSGGHRFREGHVGSRLLRRHLEVASSCLAYESSSSHPHSGPECRAYRFCSYSRLSRTKPSTVVRASRSGPSPGGQPRMGDAAEVDQVESWNTVPQRDDEAPARPPRRQRTWRQRLRPRTRLRAMLRQLRRSPRARVALLAWRTLVALARANAVLSVLVFGMMSSCLYQYLSRRAAAVAPPPPQHVAYSVFLDCVRMQAVSVAEFEENSTTIAFDLWPQPVPEPVPVPVPAAEPAALAAKPALEAGPASTPGVALAGSGAESGASSAAEMRVGARVGSGGQAGQVSPATSSRSRSDSKGAAEHTLKAGASTWQAVISSISKLSNKEAKETAAGEGQPGGRQAAAGTGDNGGSSQPRGVVGAAPPGEGSVTGGSTQAKETAGYQMAGAASSASSMEMVPSGGHSGPMSQALTTTTAAAPNRFQLATTADGFSISAPALGVPGGECSAALKEELLRQMRRHASQPGKPGSAAKWRRFTTSRVQRDEPFLLPLLVSTGTTFLSSPVPMTRVAKRAAVTVLSLWIPMAPFFYLLWRQIKGPRAASKAKASHDTKFADVAGVDTAKEELLEIVNCLKGASRYKALQAKLPRGVLLVGPPGTGKTLLARAVAGEAGVPFLAASASEFVEMYVGRGAARIRELFAEARKRTPSVIFIDELDAVGARRGASWNDERDQTLNQLLTEMDGFASDTGVLVLAATNRPETLDPALCRPGRISRRVIVDVPDQKGRVDILAVHMRTVPLVGDPEYLRTIVAAATPGLAGADLANIVNEAALLAARYGYEAVRLEDLMEAVDRAKYGVGGRPSAGRSIQQKVASWLARGGGKPDPQQQQSAGKQLPPGGPSRPGYRAPSVNI